MLEWVLIIVIIAALIFFCGDKESPPQPPHRALMPEIRSTNLNDLTSEMATKYAEAIVQEEFPSCYGIEFSPNLFPNAFIHVKKLQDKYGIEFGSRMSYHLLRLWVLPEDRMWLDRMSDEDPHAAVTLIYVKYWWLLMQRLHNAGKTPPARGISVS
jgi:hypothetical protein